MQDPFAVAREYLNRLGRAGEGTPTGGYQAPPLGVEVAAMPLDRFARAGLAVEVESSLLGRRVWFVSGQADAAPLLGRGIPRGRIYTAQELMALLSLPGLGGDGLRRIHEAKELFDGVVRGDEAP